MHAKVVDRRGPDRIIERAVLKVLDPLIDPVLSPWSFCIPARFGVKAAVRAVTRARDEGAAWVVRMGIDDCCASIPRVAGADAAA